MGTNSKIASDGKAIIFFDGVCNLCNGAVQFVIKRDKDKYFKFASLQSTAAKENLPSYGIDPTGLESILLLENGILYRKSDAALRISRRLAGWRWLNAFRIIPRIIRDRIYNWIARNRYKWFGKRDECMVPTGDLLSRFVEA